MRRIALCLLACLVAAPAMGGERLQVPQLSGWVPLASYAARDAEFSELIPEGESPTGWTRRIVVQAYRASAMTVPGFLDLVAANSAALCERPIAEPTRLGKLGPLDAGSRFVGCGRTKADGLGEYALHYAVKGRDAFYVVIRAWRGNAFTPDRNPVDKQEVADWVAFMRAVSVCDTRDATRACGRS